MTIDPVTGKRIITDDSQFDPEPGSGLQRVDCRDCGECLGYQGDGAPILWEEWRHQRCPGRLAQRWSLTREQVEDLTQTVKTGIAVSLPDFPGDESVRALRARIAAEQVLELLAGMGYEIRPTQ